jgi:diadenosine tetraphosphate (Ap4A) HIT family hydrolase
MNSCRLCSDLLLHGPVKAWNEPLFESPNFVVLPSLGALVEGWLLLVPKKHFICMGALPDSIAAEMQEMKHILCSDLQQYYGQVCAFEHGPSRPNLSLGCGVDHAHLHVVPVKFDLASAVIPFLPKDVLWSKAGLKECRVAFARGEDYLYLEQPIGAGRIAIHKGFESQLFRRAIATRIGTPNQFNWREYPQFPNVAATIHKVRASDGSVFSCMSQLEVAA